MATFSFSKCLSPSHFLTFLFLVLISKPIFSISSQTLPTTAATTTTTTNPNFISEIALYGDAEFADGGSRIKLTNPSISSSGLLIHTKPIKPTSFSTDFSFSVSPSNGNRLAFVVFPSNNFSVQFSGKAPFGVLEGNRFLGIEFDAPLDKNVGDLNANHVGVNVGSLVSDIVSDVYSIKLVLSRGVKLKSWIDYDANLKNLEVRLSELGNARPNDPLLTHSIDLSKMWEEGEVFVGIVSSNGNSSQTSSVFSWQFRVKEVPHWLHSQPVDPRIFKKKDGEDLSDHKRRVCPLTILGGVIFGTGCGALVAFVLLFLWAIVIGRHRTVAEEYLAHPVDFRYEKVNVVVEDSAEDVKK